MTRKITSTYKVLKPDSQACGPANEQSLDLETGRKGCEPKQRQNSFIRLRQSEVHKCCMICQHDNILAKTFSVGHCQACSPTERVSLKLPSVEGTGGAG